MSKVTLYSFKKSKEEQVRLSAGEFKNRVYLDLRVYHRTSEDREFRPTKKGITLAYHFLPELKQAIQKAHSRFSECKKQHESIEN